MHTVAQNMTDWKNEPRSPKRWLMWLFKTQINYFVSSSYEKMINNIKNGQRIDRKVTGPHTLFIFFSLNLSSKCWVLFHTHCS